nr:hypothetical protein [Tanacetum cinerariifolium]
MYAASSENSPHMLNKENYVAWSSRLLCYAKSRRNGKLIYNSIMNGLYVRFVQNPSVKNVKNQNKIRCYNCRGLDHLTRNCTFRPRRRDAAYFQTQLLITQKEEAGIQLQAEEFDLMAAATDLDEIGEVNANCILMANLQQESTSGTQTDKAPVYDSDELAEVQLSDNCYNNEIFTMFNQEEQGTVEQPSATVEETRAYHGLVFHNLAAKVEQVNSVNRKMKETNAVLTTKLARYKNQEKCFEISQEKYDKLERMTLDIHNWSSSAHQEINKIVKDKILPIFNQVDARVENFKIQFLKEEAKFVRDFKSLAKEADEFIAKHKALELGIERLLRAVVSQDIMSTSNLQNELEHKKEHFENCIIKKENEYAKLWNDWYKKCKECKYDKISYDKAYNDMQEKNERLQAQLGYKKGKCKDTPCVSYP